MESYPDVDAYLSCSEAWPELITALRPILVGSGLTEEIKWGKPCYTHDGANIVLLQEMKDFLAVLFVKGALLSDPEGILVAQGPNSRSGRRLELTSADRIADLADTLEAYVREAVDVEEAGLEVGPAPEPDLVDELRHRLGRDPALKAAFEALTPGRRREYNLYIAGAKKAETRDARVERYAQKILDGKGMRDR